MSLKIRRESPADIAVIEALTAAAFLEAPHAGHAEHLVVNALREAGQLFLSLVAKDDASSRGMSPGCPSPFPTIGPDDLG